MLYVQLSIDITHYTDTHTQTHAQNNQKPTFNEATWHLSADNNKLCYYIFIMFMSKRARVEKQRQYIGN